jgi:hypothetical protein
MALVKIDVSVERIASITRMKSTQEEGNLHRHRRENLKSYTALSGCTL